MNDMGVRDEMGWGWGGGLIIGVCGGISRVK